MITKGLIVRLEARAGYEDGRRAHLAGAVAAALMARADDLLAAPPEIGTADVLAAKVP